MFSLFKHKQQLSFVSFVLLLLLLLDLAPAFQITGALGGIESSGARPFRSEIHVFQHSGAPFDLFILALKQLQSLDQSNPLSYFQIAGLEGLIAILFEQSSTDASKEFMAIPGSHGMESRGREHILDSAGMLQHRFPFGIGLMWRCMR